MYVRWVVRKHKNAATADVCFHDAYLIESYRDEQNSPRQHMISYLGNIRQIGGVFPAIERELFFLRAERILNGFATITADEREQILVLLRYKVPELTAEEVLNAFRNNLRWYYRWWRNHGGAPTQQELQQLISSAVEEVGPM